MVSRRNFFSIFIMMAALLFMTQFSEVFKASSNRYNMNEFAAAEVESGEKSWQGSSLTLESSELRKKDYIVFIGDAESDLGDIVSQWCHYTKRELVVLSGADEYGSDRKADPEMIILDSQKVNYQKDLGRIMKMGKETVPMVFCGLPNYSVIYRQEKLQELLGIKELRQEEIEIEGIYLFKDFLLGGEALYQVMREEDEKRQDMDLTIPWYVTGKGTKTYMTGVMEDKELKREEYPPIIWRNTYQGNMIFAVNGDYMESLTGLGFLNAIAYEINSYEIYPVVNAQNVMLVEYPGFSLENEEELMEIYSRDARAVLRDVMWPSVSALAERNKLKLTCYVSPQYDYEDEKEPLTQDVVFYMQQMKEIDAEAGKSLTYSGEISLAEKNRRDKSFYEATEGYAFTTAYVGDTIPKDLKDALSKKEMEDIRTVSSLYQDNYPLLSYYTEDVTLQCATGTSEEYTYSMDLQSKSLATALAYSNVVVDMHDVMWPEQLEDQWQHFFDTASSNINTYWTNYPVFARTTMTESDERVRDLLNMDFRDSRVGDTIHLNITNAEEGWFLLRTHGEEIGIIYGAEYEKVEKDAYLIHALLPTVTIQMECAEEVLQYGEK